MEVYVKISFISIFLFFLVFKHDFITCIDFTHIAASNTANDMASQIRSHTKYLIHSFAHFVVKMYEKFSLIDGFKYDLMMILHSGSLFWATLYRRHSGQGVQ